MFTGLVEQLGTVYELRPNAGGGSVLGIRWAAPVTDVSVGESIAVNGACLTVTSGTSELFYADASPETLARTNLGALRPGRKVNLERALRVGDRLGGHFVTGHVDCQGELTSRKRQGNMEVFRFSLADASQRLLVIKGSVAVDGISLTVNHVEPGWFEVAIIPHTLRHTTLADMPAGSQVNLEMDLIGKYVERLLAGRDGGEGGPDRMNREFLARHGFL